MYFHTLAQLIHAALRGKKKSGMKLVFASDQKETATYYNQTQIYKVVFFFLASCHSYYHG